MQSGIAFHWYTGGHFESLERLRHMFPNLLLFHTEGCTGYSHFKPQDELFNAEMYAYEIMEDFNHGTNGFIDWNIVLDYKGGPNHVKNYCNSLIMINKKGNDLIKTPAFYYVSHFAKFLKPFAKRIHFNKFSENISVLAFKNPDKSVMIVLLNKTDKNIEYNLCYNQSVFHDNLDSHAIVTFVIQE
ncbi:MAG: glycoside hydrolase family 30 protein [Clostridia bacterium]|nr:glycoside hydrolase family 30 protein [Clostridia bacterium]